MAININIAVDIEFATETPTSTTTKPIVTFVTGNKKKLEEVRAILGPAFEVVARDFDLPEYQGEPGYVAEEKCKAATELVDGPVLVEDTCLCFNAHGGLPGPYVKWYLKDLGLDGLPRMLNGWDDKTGYALCTFAYGSRNGPIKIFKGKCDGTIVAPRGPKSFGWDAIFKPDGREQTYAEMGEKEKNIISPRARALADLRSYLMNP